MFCKGPETCVESKVPAIISVDLREMSNKGGGGGGGGGGV